MHTNIRFSLRYNRSGLWFDKLLQQLYIFVMN